MPVENRCPGALCCNDPTTNEFRGCYNPAQCEACVGGTVIRNDTELLRAACKECRFIPTASQVVLVNTCENWEECCYGTCYNKICEKCNHTTKRVENKCKDSGSSFTCCKNANGSVAQCYDPTDCKECNTITGEVGEKTCPILNTNGIQVQEVCCGGICYNPLCNDCDPNTKTITSKCTQGRKTQCCFDNGTFQGCYDPYACEYCTVNGVSNSLTANQKENCWKCDANGNSYQECSGSECCVNQSIDPKIGICITPCQECQNGIVVDQCSSNEFCCYDECLPKNSATTCKGCFPDDDGNLEVKENKCGWIVINTAIPGSGGDTRKKTVSKTSGETECCNGICFDPTCSRCRNGNIEADPDKDNDPKCCGGYILKSGEACCKNSVNRREVYKTDESYNEGCCPNALADSGIYNKTLQGCCPYGQNNNSIYSKQEYSCCLTSSADFKLYRPNAEICCGNTVVDQYRFDCCEGSGDVKYPRNKGCEDCNPAGIPPAIKKYDEKNCQECRPSKVWNQADSIVENKCEENSNGKTTCCMGSGECYDTNNECETCEESGTERARLQVKCVDPDAPNCCYGTNEDGTERYECCRTNQGCCNGRCYDNTRTSCKDCVDNQIIDNKCLSNNEGKTTCCNGTCIDTCQKCTYNNTVIEDKCPDDPSEPLNLFCCGGTCHGICQKCVTRNGTKVVEDDPDCDCCQTPSDSITGATHSICCRASENKRCCRGQCVPSNYVECDNQCVPADQCCNLSLPIFTGQIIGSDEICCNNQVYKKDVCGECCNNECSGADYKCCTDGVLDPYTCNKNTEPYCCNGSCCATECCVGDCCEDDPIKGSAQCCNGYGGGCFYTYDCKTCNNGTINSTLADHEECCAGSPYSPRDCEKCVSNVKVPYVPSGPSCFCYYFTGQAAGKEFCSCPLAGLTINVDTAGTGHCCDAAIFGVYLVNEAVGGPGTRVDQINLNNGSGDNACQDASDTVTVSPETARDIIRNLPPGANCCSFKLRLVCELPPDSGGFRPFGDDCHTSIAYGVVTKTLADGSSQVVWQRSPIDETSFFNICDPTINP